MSDDVLNVESQTIQLLINAGGRIADVDLDPAVSASLQRLRQLDLAWQIGPWYGETTRWWELMRGAVRVYYRGYKYPRHRSWGPGGPGYGVYRNGDTSDDWELTGHPYYRPGDAEGHCLILLDVDVEEDDYTEVLIEDLGIADPYLQVSNRLTGSDGAIHLSKVDHGIQSLLDPLVAVGIAHQDPDDVLGDTWYSRPAVYHPASEQYGVYQRPGDDGITCWIDFGGELVEVSIVELIAAVSG